MKKILKNDIVLINSGSQKGKIGRVLKIIGDYVQIEGTYLLNKIFKIKFFNKLKYGFKKKYIPIHISNVSFFLNKPFKIGFKFLNGKKFRYLKKINFIL